MKTTIERELKFEGDDIQLEELGGEPIEPHVFASSYHDTPDRRLLRAGITLRRRVENGVSKWQLKLPSEESRLELEEPGGPASPPDALAGLLSGMLRGSELELIAMLETRRHGRLVEGVEVTIDDVSVLEGMAVVGRFSEIEAELVQGSRASIERVGRALRELGATPGGETSKIMRVVELPRASRVDPKAPALEHLRAFIRGTARRAALERSDRESDRRRRRRPRHEGRRCGGFAPSCGRPARCSNAPGATGSGTSSISSAGSSAPFATSTSSSSISPPRQESSAPTPPRRARCSHRFDRSEIRRGRGSGPRWTTSDTSSCSTRSRPQPDRSRRDEPISPSSSSPDGSSRSSAPARGTPRATTTGSSTSFGFRASGRATRPSSLGALAALRQRGS